MDTGRQFAEALVKQLTGGDKIKARHLYQDFDEFDPTHKLFLAANNKPNVSDGDAIWRRIYMIPFTVSVPDSEQDKDLLNKLREELPGILTWALKGCAAWQEAGRLKAPCKVEAATASYRTEMDATERFLEEHCTVASDLKVKASRLFEAYARWCGNSGEQVRLNAHEFSDRMKKRNFESKRMKTGYFWLGIGLNEDEDMMR